MAARVLEKAPSHTVTILELADVGTDGGDKANAFVAQDHLNTWSVFVRGAERIAELASLPLERRSPPQSPESVMETRT